ncbi:MAG: hypothetical protein AB7E49_10950 [Campylobacterales bacterium]
MRFVWALWLLSAAAWAMPANYWAHNEPFELRKDEFASWFVDGNVFSVRWSLFHNRGLVTHIKYDHFPYQGILYDDYKQNAVKIPVKTTQSVSPPEPFAMVLFEGFDAEKKRAKMRLFLFDPQGIVTLKKAE